MTCQACKADWCWLCNKDISPSKNGGVAIEQHYNPANVTSLCAGAQFQQTDGEYLRLQYLSTMLWNIIACPLLFVFVVTWVAGWPGWMVVTCCCLCCCLGKLLEDEEDGAADRLVMVYCCACPVLFTIALVTLIFMGFSLVWTLALTPILLVTSPFWVSAVQAGSGSVTYKDVFNLWIFCGKYTMNTMCCQLCLRPCLGDDDEDA